MTDSISLYFHAALEILAGAQTEIMLFFLAIVMHSLVFSKHSLRLKPKQSKSGTPPGPPVEQPRQGTARVDTKHVFALKAAVREGNLNSAFGHLQAIGSAVPTMPQQLLQGLVRLAMDENKISVLLQRFHALGAAGTALVAVVAECGRRADFIQLEAANESGLLSKLVADSSLSAQATLLKGVASKLELAVVIFDACGTKTSGHFNTLVEACIASRAFTRAEAVVQQAIDSNLADVMTYNTAIKAYIKSNQLNRAEAMVQRMRASGLSPTCVTMNELLDPLVKDCEQCWRLYTEMCSWGVKPNHVTCSILLKSIHARSNITHVERILKVVDSVEDGIDEVLMSSVIEACIRVDRSDMLQKLLERQRTAKRVTISTPHAYGSIVRASGYVGDIKGVWDAWQEMRTRHIELTSISIGCMVEALSSNGDPEAGYELIRDVMADSSTRPLMNAVIYGSVMKGFSHLKNVSRMWTVYEELVSEGMKLSITTYNTLVDACARNNEMSRIPKLLEQMQQQQIEPNVITYSAIIKGYCGDRRLDKAFELFDDMKRLKNASPDEHTYNTLINGCACQGLYDRGMAVLQDMEIAGVRPTNFTLSVLMKLCARARRQKEAFELCTTLTEKYALRPNIQVYNNLINTCIPRSFTVHSADIPRSLEVFMRVLRERVRPDCRTYTLLLRGCIACRSAEDAASLLRAATFLSQATCPFVAIAGNRLQVVPHGGLPVDLLLEVLNGISQDCGNERLALQLLAELKTLKEYASKLPALLR